MRAGTGGRSGGGGETGSRGRRRPRSPPPAGAHRWVAAGWSGLRPRYEHATFLPATDPPRLWVFGGAHPAGNRSCVQALDLGECPRTRGSGTPSRRRPGLPSRFGSPGAGSATEPRPGAFGVAASWEGEQSAFSVTTLITLLIKRLN